MDNQDLKTYLKGREKQWDEVYSGPKEKMPWLANPIPTQTIEDFAQLFRERDTILDYGCGDGLLVDILIKNNLSLVCSDVSAEALKLVKEKHPEIELIQTGNPNTIQGSFDGILVWGVFHHIDKSLWDEYLDSFNRLLKSGGHMLIGGHSMKDSEFAEGFRISPTTGEHSTAVDFLADMIPEHGFKLVKSDYFDFIEGFTGHQRAFKYYLVQKSS